MTPYRNYNSNNDIMINSHKLMYHPGRVDKFLNNKMIYPIYIEISPTNICNLKCSFCALEYSTIKPNTLSFDSLDSLLNELSDLGIKSIMFAGEGEPFVHNDIVKILESAKKYSLDSAVSTNGILLDNYDPEQILSNLKWLRISLNASNAQTYSTIHMTSSDIFNRVINNIKLIVKTKKRNKHKTQIGAQAVLIKDNINEMEDMCKLLKNLEIDYFTIKPYSEHRLEKEHRIQSIDYSEILDNLENKVKKYETDDFKVLIRSNAFKKIQLDKNYLKCYGVNFYCHIDSFGDIYPCSTFIGNSEMSYGNFLKESFKSAWNSEKRNSVIKKLESEFPAKCRPVCRMDEINRYLSKLKNPPEHVNFI